MPKEKGVYTALPDGRPVGIMADSHGNTAAIVAALAACRSGGCGTVLHLGDICDSESPEAAGAAIGLLAAAGVLAVLGNNEQALIRRWARRPETADTTALDFMARLPLQIEMPGLLFVHNRPFPDRLGRSCLVGDLTPSDDRRIDGRYSGVVLFRGHSHQPAVRSTGRNVGNAGRAPLEGQTLGAAENWVVTCGALEDGWYMTWRHRERRLAVHRL